MYLPRCNSASSFTLWALLAFLLASVTSALDLSDRVTSLGPLGVQLDYDLAKYGNNFKPTATNSVVKPPRKTDNADRSKSDGSGMYVWSSHLRFNQPVETMENGTLLAMLYSGWNEFHKNAVEYAVGGNIIPTAMTIMAFDHEVLLSTTIKAKDFTMNYAPTPVRGMLEQCSQNYEGTKGQIHYRKGSCGEITTAHQFFLSRHPRIDPNNVEEAGRLMRSISPREITLQGDAKSARPILPCATDAKEKGLDKWGCNLVVKDFGIRYIPIDTKPIPYKSLATLAGGLAGSPTQQSLYYPTVVKKKSGPKSKSKTFVHTTFTSRIHSSNRHATTEPAHTEPARTKPVHSKPAHTKPEHTKPAPTKHTPKKPTHTVLPKKKN